MVNTEFQRGVKTELYKGGEVVVYVYAFKLTVQTGELMF